MQKRKILPICLGIAILIVAFVIIFLDVRKQMTSTPLYATELSDDCKYELNVPYLKTSAGQCTMDIAWDTSEGTAPLVVIVHGGGWLGGDKQTFTSVQIALSAEGYSVANINYDHVPDVTITKQLEQVKAAIVYLVENADTYEIDPSQIVVMGYSAGGHLATLAVEDFSAEDSDIQISGCIDIFGPNALEYYITHVENEVSNWFITTPEIIDGKKNGNILEEIAKIDPAQQIPSNMPPVLVIQGNNDTIVPQAVSEFFYQELQDAGSSSSISIIQGMGHDLDLDLTYSLIKSFITKYTDLN